MLNLKLLRVFYYRLSGGVSVPGGGGRGLCFEGGLCSRGRGLFGGGMAQHPSGTRDLLPPGNRHP